MATTAYPVFPITLPQSPLLSAYSETNKSMIKSMTAANKSILVRKTTTRLQTAVKVSFDFTKAQLEIFYAFFDETLDGGARIFTFTHPRTKEAVLVSFDPSQQTAFTVTPNGSMRNYKVDAQFIIWG